MHREHERVLEFIREPDPGHFEECALAVFRHQYETIPEYRRWCEEQGIGPEKVRGWREIPPVPAVALKYRRFACGEPQRVFRSSGTTLGSERRSEHAMPDLRLYRAAALGGLEQFLFPGIEEMPIFSLIPSAEAWPHSSLAQMVSWAVERFGSPESAYFASEERFEFAALCAALEERARAGTPVCLMATTAALVRFFDFCRTRNWSVRLPHGSRVMDTGGQKGLERPLSRRGLLHAIWQVLAVPGYFVVNEYGMSELSSQYYDSVIADRWAGRWRTRRKLAPPWLRTRVLDPVQLRDVPEGEVGLLCHVDLANAGTVLALLTEDLGRLVDGGLEVLGRAPGAEARGCSLAVAAFAEEP